jgi:hypothetical protein
VFLSNERNNAREARCDAIRVRQRHQFQRWANVSPNIKHELFLDEQPSSEDASGRYDTLDIVSEINKDVLKKIDADFSRSIPRKYLPILASIPITVEELRSYYFGNKPISEETLSSFIDFIGDIGFYREIIETADINAKLSSSTPTYLYYLTYKSKTSLMKKIININFSGTRCLLIRN